MSKSPFFFKISGLFSILATVISKVGNLNLILKLKKHHFSAQFIERGIRSLKGILYRMMEEKGSRNWPGMVPTAVSIMNGRLHSATGLPPNHVTAANAGKVFRRLYPLLSRNLQPFHALIPKFKLGDQVRTIIPSSVLSKKTAIKNSEEIFKISRILFHPTVRYKIATVNDNELLTGSYNEKELIPASI